MNNFVIILLSTIEKRVNVLSNDTFQVKWLYNDKNKASVSLLLITCNFTDNNGSNGLPNLALSEQDLINSFLNRTDEEYFCSHVNHGFFRTYIYFIFVSGFVIPFTIITLCYTFIVMKILKPTEMKTRSLQVIINFFYNL